MYDKDWLKWIIFAFILLVIHCGSEKKKKGRNDVDIIYLLHPSSTERKDEPTNSPSSAYFVSKQHRSRTRGSDIT